MNLIPGIDTKPAKFLLIAKVDLPFDDQKAVVELLQKIESLKKDKLAPEREHKPLGVEEPRSVTDFWKTSMVVGFGLSFFLGRLSGREENPGIPNFPPEGTFERRASSRFNISLPVPKYLRTMNAFGDREWVAQKGNDDNEAAYQQWLEEGESDLIFNIESNNKFLVNDLWENLRVILELHDVEIRIVHEGFNRGDGRDHLGWHDGISNMQDLSENNPHAYRNHIYLPRPAPSYPGENVLNRDPEGYNGGTYMVHRKYQENIDKWNGAYTHDDEKNQIIGREKRTGCVLHHGSHKLLEKEPDSAEVELAPVCSHILQARGGSNAPFTGPFPPLKHGDRHVFKTQDIRIKRRGCNYWEIDKKGESKKGLHFICFQNNIQQTGFEFINNIWLMNPMFRGSEDHLMSVENGFIEPLEGAYYFIPGPCAAFTGDIFFK